MVICHLASANRYFRIRLSVFCFPFRIYTYESLNKLNIKRSTFERYFCYSIPIRM